MRLVYLDEAGIANAAHEPYVVVAGVIISPDDAAFEIENHLRGLARRYVSDNDEADGLIFHAKEIWHGSKNFDRQQWPREKRWRLLRDLALIPSLFKLPIACGYALRSEGQKGWAANWTPSTYQIQLLSHCFAFVRAVEQAEIWMKLHARTERAMLIAENTPHAKEALKMFHGGYRYHPNRDLSWAPEAFHSEHIVESILFADKLESALLQVADLCAFFIRRRLSKKADSDPFYGLLRPQIVSPDRSELLATPPS